LILISPAGGFVLDGITDPILHVLGGVDALDLPAMRSRLGDALD
jgi:hypothetical protein